MIGHATRGAVAPNKQILARCIYIPDADRASPLAASRLKVNELCFVSCDIKRGTRGVQQDQRIFSFPRAQRPRLPDLQ